MDIKDYIICEEWGSEVPITLKQLRGLIPTLEKRYGEESSICFDNNDNNIKVKIKPTRPTRIGFGA